MMRFAWPENLTPPDGYSYTFPGGHVIKASFRRDWFDKIAKFAKDNDIVLEPDWKARCEDQMCSILPGGWCKYEDGTDAPGFINQRIDLGYVARGMDVMLSLVKEPDPYVDQEEAERRAKICSGCQANIPVSGCAPCVGLSNMILNVIGPKRSTTCDHVLRTCAICGCSSQGHVWIKAEILAKGVTQGQIDQFNRLGHCWKGKQLRELQRPA